MVRWERKASIKDVSSNKSHFGQMEINSSTELKYSSEHGHPTYPTPWKKKLGYLLSGIYMGNSGLLSGQPKQAPTDRKSAQVE